MRNKKDNDDPFLHLLDIILARKMIILIGFFAVFVIVLAGVLTMPPTYVASTRLYINRPAVPRLDVPFANDLGSSYFVTNQVALISSRVISEQVVKKLNMHQETEPSRLREFLNKFFKKKKADPLESAINYLERNTWASYKKKTNIVEIHAEAISAKAAANIANTLAEVYINYANNLLFKKSDSAYGFIEKRVEAARRQVEKSEQALEAFSQQENLTSIKDTIAPLLEKLTDYEAQQEQVKSQIATLEVASSGDNLKTTMGTSGNINQFPLNESSEVKELKSRLKTLSINLETALTLYTEDHPEVKSLRSNIAKLEEKLSQLERYNLADLNNTNDTQSYLNKLNREKDYLAQQIQRLDTNLRTLSKKEFEWAKLNRGLQNNEAKLTLLLGKLESAGILKTNESQQAGITIIDTASPPPYPQQKKKTFFLAIGLIIGLIFGLSMAFIVEYLDDSFKTVEDIEESLKLPILATFPNADKKMQS